MKLGSLFTGYGGLDMAVEEHFDAETVWCSDIDPGACKIVAHRMPGIPNLGDITTVDWAAVEPVDILCGGFPCQDLSHAGKRAGMRPGTRSGLWSHMAYAISQLRPRYVVAENVRGLLSASADSDLEPCPWCLGGAEQREPALRALGAVLGDLAELGYDTQWTGLRAADVGATHGRFRVFLIAADTQHDGRHVAPVRGGASSSQADRRLLQSERPSDHYGPAASNAEPSRLQGQPFGRLGGAGVPAPGHREIATDAERLSQPGRRGLRDVGSAPSDSAGEGLQRQRDRNAADNRGAVATDAAEPEWRRAQPEHLGTTTGRTAEPGERASAVAWGTYEPAIRRWERRLGRPAPAPTETSPKGSQRLSPRFVEWMMGLPAGWVCDVPGLTRNEQLKALGNGVVSQQALAALRIMASLEAAA